MNNKGGVGKTASSTTIAHMMATEFGKRVLLIDLDPQMNTTCMFSEIDFIELFNCLYLGENRKAPKSVEDLLLDSKMDIHECIYHTRFENLDIIPSYLTLAQTEDLIKADIKTPQQFRLRKHLTNVEDEYDYCIIDGSPSISIINVNGLTAADEIYIPLNCDGYSLLGVGITMNLISAVKQYVSTVEIGGMFFTQFDSRNNVSKVTFEILKNNFGEYILPITISSSKNIKEGSLVQSPLLEYDRGKKKSRVTEQYLQLTKYILEK